MDENSSRAHNQQWANALAGKRIVVTRAGNQGAAFVLRLQQLGAAVVHCPAISFAPPLDAAPLDAAIDSLARFAWIVFASANAVSAFRNRLLMRHGAFDVTMPAIASVGAATSAAIEESGWSVQFSPSASNGETLGRELPANENSLVLVPRAESGGSDLVAAMRNRNLAVVDVAAYRTVADRRGTATAKTLSSARIDALTFTSPSSISHFLEAARTVGWNAFAAQRDNGMLVVCIGPTTAASAQAHGLEANAIAADQSEAGLIGALVSCLAGGVSTHPMHGTESLSLSTTRSLFRSS
ncbi:MAG: uroporphyrinogen-III synthase [Gemmatimonadaceae bacterium]